MDEEGRFLGTTVPTGLRAHFAERLREVGIEVPARLFGIPDPQTIGRRNGAR